jgi:hypothetical protein
MGAPMISRFVLDLQQLDRAFIAIGDDQRFRIQDEYAVKGSIENSIGTNCFSFRIADPHYSC